MPNVKTAKPKKQGVKIASSEVTDETEVLEPQTPKIKKNVGIEIADEGILTEEKSDDETPKEGEDGELGSDEVSLDDEDVNPFGDKWEE